MGAAACSGEAELADLLEETTSAPVLLPQPCRWPRSRCKVVGVAGGQKCQPAPLPAFGYREHPAPDQAVHPDTKSISFGRGRQCLPAALWRIDAFISLSMCLQSPGTAEPGFVTRKGKKGKGKERTQHCPHPCQQTPPSIEPSFV